MKKKLILIISVLFLTTACTDLLDIRDDPYPVRKAPKKKVVNKVNPDKTSKNEIGNLTATDSSQTPIKRVKQNRQR